MTLVPSLNLFVVNVNELTTNVSEPQTEESEHYVEQTFFFFQMLLQVELQICTNSNPQISKVGINMEKKPIEPPAVGSHEGVYAG